MPPVPATTITPAVGCKGRRVPGDKSISTARSSRQWPRGVIWRTTHPAPIASRRHAPWPARRDIQRGEHGAVTVVGRGPRGWSTPSGLLDAGNSGSTMRMLAGLLAAQRFSAELTGDASLSRRPMRRVIEPLSRMGARIEATDGHAPLTIHGASLHAIAHRPDVPSAQVKSAVLLAGLYAEGKTSVTEPAQTRDHTERALAAFGLDVGTTGNTITVAGGRDAIGQPAVPVIFLRRSGWSRRPLSGSRVAIDDVGLNHANGPHRRAAPLGLGLRCTS